MQVVIEQLKQRHGDVARPCPPTPSEADLSLWEVCSMCLKRQPGVNVFHRFTCSGPCAFRAPNHMATMCGPCASQTVSEETYLGLYCGFCAGPWTGDKTTRGILVRVEANVPKPESPPKPSGWFR